MPLTEALYGKKAAALYQQAGAFQAEARTFQLKAKDAYFQANNWAGYDDMRRARQYAPLFCDNRYITLRPLRTCNAALPSAYSLGALSMIVSSLSSAPHPRVFPLPLQVVAVLL